MKIFTPKENMFDRIEQVVPLFLKNSIKLVLPYILYQVFFVVILGSVFMFYMLVGVLGILKSNGGNFGEILYNPMMIYFMFFGFLFFIIFALSNIPIVLATLKSIRQCLNNQEITPIENIKWGVKNIINSFQTYWYIFAYVYLFPALLFIFGGILFIVGSGGSEIQLLGKIGITGMILSFILFLFFAIYRGYRAVFSIMFAVDKNGFTKKNFIKSVEITKNNWWRIFGNIFLIGIIINFGISFLNGLTGLFLPSSLDFLSVFNGDMNEFNVDKVITLLDTFNPYIHILNSIVKNILNVVGIVFVLMFTYVFMIRLQDEFDNKTEDIIINNLDGEL